METVVPESFLPYVTSPVGNGSMCEAGAVTDEDGMNQRPLAYLKDNAGRVQWVRGIALPPETFQARATHCIHDDGRLYVLIQADTRPEQTLSQTLLSVASLAIKDGAVAEVRNVAPPNVNGAYSAWVDESDKGLRLVDGSLVINGHYFRLEDPENRRPFESVVKIGL